MLILLTILKIFWLKVSLPFLLCNFLKKSKLKREGCKLWLLKSSLSLSITATFNIQSFGRCMRQSRSHHQSMPGGTSRVAQFCMSILIKSLKLFWSEHLIDFLYLFHFIKITILATFCGIISWLILLLIKTNNTVSCKYPSYLVLGTNCRGIKNIW